MTSRERSLRATRFAADRQSGLADDGTKSQAPIERYSGNPLALKLVAETIEELYLGEIDAFLQEDAVIFADISDGPNSISAPEPIIAF